MLVLARKVGEEVLITPPGLRLRVVAIFPQLTLSLTGPRGTLTVHPGGDECQLPGCQVKIKALERHRGRVQLGFTAPRGVKILRGEIAHKGVTGCR